METIINVDDVSFSYGTQTEQALSHISLSVNKGDFIGIIGPSGAGKSTLAACLSGAVPHHYTGTFFGSVTVDGNDTCGVSLTDVSQIVGSVLQDIDTQMVASVVEDEMLFGLENFGVPHDQIEQRVSETLETVGISDLRDREIATLSGGQKQKVAIAAILAMHPRVLVLDEPTAALDVRATPPAPRWSSRPYARPTAHSASPSSSLSKKSPCFRSIATACSCSIMAKSRYRASRTRSSRTPMSSAPSASIARVSRAFSTASRPMAWPAALPVWMLMRPSS